MAKKKETGRFVYCGGCQKMRSIDDYGVDDRTRRPVREAECLYCAGELSEKEDTIPDDDKTEDVDKKEVKYLDTISANAIPSKQTIENFAHSEKKTTYRMP